MRARVLQAGVLLLCARDIYGMKRKESKEKGNRVAVMSQHAASGQRT